jgi:flagella basal body P-ring formation protein FlgA
MRNAAFLAALACLTTTARAQSARTPVASRDLMRGTVLSAADIAWTDSASSAQTTGENAARDAARVSAGWVARRNIRAGEILEAPSVSQPDLVSSGDAVDVVYSAPGVTIRVRGTAVGSGARGDEVYVRLDNRKRLRGIVAAANTVRVM